MEKQLIYIKHHFSFLWRLIEYLNDRVFYFVYFNKLTLTVEAVFNNLSKSNITYRVFKCEDISMLTRLYERQSSEDLVFFHPHAFDIKALKRQYGLSSFLMMGAFNENELIGYFFLRFFVTGNCFVGRLVDKDYRGKGIGILMNSIMYDIAWRMKFRCLSTISIDNKKVMKAHARNSAMRIIKKLDDNYLLIEFTQKLREN